MSDVLDQLIAAYLQRKAEREMLDAEMGELSEGILARLAIGESQEIEPGKGVRVQGPSRRFDPLVAQQVLTPEQIMGITTTIIDREKAKAILTGALYDQCTRLVGQPSVRVL